jgi:methyltransferase (TIGR00027 family)
MSQKSVEHKPSETAVFAALHRAIANKEFRSDRFGPDYLAEYFLPAHFRFFIKFKKIRINIKKKLKKLLPGLHEYIIARTAWFDSVFSDAIKKEIPQIVMLGAGYDSRAYRFAKLNGATKIIELDIAPTQNRKRKCLRKARIEIPKHVTLVPIDFNKEPLKNVLEKAGYENHKKTLFLWEGVSYYLDSESVDTTLKFISRSSHKESVIAFDYTTSVSEEEKNYGAKEFYQTMKKQHANEGLLFALDGNKTESFLEQRGLKIIDHMDSREIERTFLLNENGSSIGQITGNFRFVSASPENQKQ